MIEEGDQEADIDDNVAERVTDEESNSLVIEFKETLTFPVVSKHLVVNFDFKNLDGASFKIFLQTDDYDEIILNYSPTDEFLALTHGEVVFGFGSDSEDGGWLRVTRDVVSDLVTSADR